jgi:hypothetical protein
MKKKIIISSSVLFLIASLLMHFFIKDSVSDPTGSLLDFIKGALFGMGISVPTLLLNERFRD